MSTHRTQRDAIDAARAVARSGKGELIIHRSDGRIADRTSYSADPFPPKSDRKVLFHGALDKADREAVQHAVGVVVGKSSAKAGTQLAPRGSHHVVPHEGGWAVKEEGRARPVSVHRNQREAIAAARHLARQHDGKLIIHGRDGSIRNPASRDRKH